MSLSKICLDNPIPCQHKSGCASHKSEHQPRNAPGVNGDLDIMAWQETISHIENHPINIQ